MVSERAGAKGGEGRERSGTHLADEGGDVVRPGRLLLRVEASEVELSLLDPAARLPPPSEAVPAHAAKLGGAPLLPPTASAVVLDSLGLPRCLLRGLSLLGSLCGLLRWVLRLQGQEVAGRQAGGVAEVEVVGRLGRQGGAMEVSRVGGRVATGLNDVREHDVLEGAVRQVLVADVRREGRRGADRVAWVREGEDLAVVDRGRRLVVVRPRAEDRVRAVHHVHVVPGLELLLAGLGRAR